MFTTKHSISHTTSQMMVVLALTTAMLAGACVPLRTSSTSGGIGAAVAESADETSVDAAPDAVNQLTVANATVADVTVADVTVAQVTVDQEDEAAFVPDPVPFPEPEAAATAIRVGDPRPGNLRVDPNADGLGDDYEPTLPVPVQEVTYGTDPAQRLDLYLPNVEDAPVIVYLHAGGWVSGGKQNVPALVLRFVERGYAVASVGYRLAPDHVFPAQLHDAKHAIRWLKAFGAREGLIDGDRMVVFGTSAGGHLASMVATTPGQFEPTDVTDEEATFDSSVVGLVSAVGPTDLRSFYVPEESDLTHPWRTGLPEALLGCEPCSEKALIEASPASHLGPDLPPAYFAYGELDTDLVHPISQGEAIADAWAQQAGFGSAWFDFVDGAGHNFDHTAINQRAVESFVDLAVR